MRRPPPDVMISSGLAHSPTRRAASTPAAGTPAPGRARLIDAPQRRCLAPKPPGSPSTALVIQITPYSARSRHGATQPETRLNPSRWVPQGHADHPSQLGPRGTHPGPPAPPNAALAARRAAPAGLVRVLGAALRSQHWGARRVSRGAGSCAAVERRAYV